jgi:3'(2'), 5'-bisphosphate nucleotidase
VSNATYIGCEGSGAELREPGKEPRSIGVALESESPVRVVGSRSHRGDSLNRFLENLGDFEMHPMGSSLKFCQIARGAADVYPRLGPTSEWDTAAAQAVVEQAGGQVVELDGTPLSYNTKADILNPHFLVLGPQDHDWLGLVPISD